MMILKRDVESFSGFTPLSVSGNFKPLTYAQPCVPPDPCCSSLAVVTEYGFPSGFCRFGKPVLHSLPPQLSTLPPRIMIRTDHLLVAFGRSASPPVHLVQHQPQSSGMSPALCMEHRQQRFCSRIKRISCNHLD